MQTKKRQLRVHRDGLFSFAAVSELPFHGAIMSYSESLLYAGYENLNLTQIFMASIFIGASGAIMDMAVDITSAVNEVVEKKPGITWKEAAISGIHAGRAAMGTMTTTLLLAYSGGYVALLIIHGIGYAHYQHFKLLICTFGNSSYHCRKLWSGCRSSLYSSDEWNPSNRKK